MAAEGAIPVRHEDVFLVPVLVLAVEPVNDFDKVKAKEPDPQMRDKETGKRLWSGVILDPSARTGQREIKVKIAADVQPVPPNGLMGPCEFEGLAVIPYLDSNRVKPRVAIAYRAAGFRARTRPAGASPATAPGGDGKAA
jgi:hypothetical protein